MLVRRPVERFDKRIREHVEAALADPALIGLDGITVDALGNIYGAVNFGFSVVRIRANDNDISMIAAGPPLDFPTGLTFGTGPGQHTLYVVNAAFVSPPAGANPAVLAIPIGAPGLSYR